MTIELTLLTSKSGLLTKTIRLGVDGKLESISANLMSFGSACRLNIDKMSEFAEFLNNGLGEDQAIASGCIRGDKPSKVTVTRVASMEALESVGDGAECISRSKKYLDYRAQPTMFVADTDLAQAPARVRDMFSAGCRPWDVFVGICPGLDGVGHAMRRSTSSGIIDTQTGQVFADSGGWHTFWGIADGTDTKAFTEWLHDGCVMVGLGWGFVTACGTILHRSIIDVAVASPERIVYEASPRVIAPLWQDPDLRLANHADGPLFDSRSVRPRTADEKALISAAWAAEEALVAPRAAATRACWIDCRAAEMSARTGKSIAHCRRVAEQIADEHHLFPEAILEFKELGAVTVAEIWENPRRYDGKELADPIEGSSYKSGLQCAKLFVTKDGRPWVKSFAHGGAQYHLCAEAEWGGNAREHGDAYARRLSGFGPLPVEAEAHSPATCERRASSTSKADLSDKSIKAFAFKLLRAKAPAEVLVRKVLEANRSLAAPLDEARVFQNIAWAHSVHYAI